MGKTIDASNYFEASKGVFNKLSSRITMLFLTSVGDDVEWAGKTWKFNFKSSRKFNLNSSNSFYWTNGTHLIRVSDHWSRGPVNRVCGRIGRCWWILSDRSRSMKKGCADGFYAGIIAFNDMTKIS